MSYNKNSSDIVEYNFFATYYPLFLVIIGTLFNSLTFIILCRRKFRGTSKQLTLHYMRVIAIFDILMLYGRNFDHFLYYAYGFTLQTYSIPFCKLFSFLNYFIPQVSAWLRVFICFDRYLSLSRIHKTWFAQSRNVLIIIICIVTIFTLINFHFFLFACYDNDDGTINMEARLYEIYPLWNYINLVLYNCLPFIFMIAFYGNVIYHLMRFRHTNISQNLRRQYRSMSVTLIIMTFLFLIMTMPATICSGFFYASTSKFIRHLFDYILYTYHILSFLIYLITFREFRKEVILMITL
ncbi:unnamed protein product [Adineta steineri]|uniref:G-protein coupled receptors family 1 profile domain-containing protein n=1 Tax=Adineta steineri TaxID=433720 RepID=A0A815QWW4_9BILA|nr:unnamed protein product [Adineta steineri]CAF4249063.1 unnamed protein product [Adineta steineri]